MKIKALMIAIFAITSFSLTAQSNNEKLDLQVEGVCGMCKERIEEAAMRTTGVKFAEWHKTDRTLHLVYNGKKVDEETIRTAISATGHRLDNMPADSSAYEALPDCCKYDNGIKSH
tara:strand:- start:3854 stop:4201 length:348 start_codon:yes stop_codon:yes gene_type:complete